MTLVGPTGHNDPMDRTELAKIVSIRTNIGRKDVNRVVVEALRVLEEAIIRGEDVKFAGFGVFSVRHLKPKLHYQPRTGEKRLRPARSRPAFTPSTTFCRRIRAAVPPKDVWVP